MKTKKKCVVCGFDYGVCNHHIIKRKVGGANEEENYVNLCPNHHWIADFGTEEERLEVLNLITKTTGKVGKEISDEEKGELDLKVKALEEEFLCGVPFPSSIFGTYEKPFSDEEWKEHKKSWNYNTTRKLLLGRGCSPAQSSLLSKRAEILILIKKLKNELKGTTF